MRILGVLLIAFGIFALLFQGVTFFTAERVVDAGPFAIDWQRPHTIFIHPIVGVVSLIAGLALLLVGRHPAEV